MMNLRVMTWNLLEGGHTPRQRPPQLDRGRLEAAKALIARVRPDVVILNEALWAEPYQGYHQNYADLFGFEHACARLYDGSWGNAILSHYPVIACQDFRIHNRGGLVSTIQAGSSRVQVGTYHPHPSRFASNKASDYRALVGGTDKTLPLVLGGDFNAISPQDHPNHEKLTEAFSRFSSTPGPDSARFIEGGQFVFQALAAEGMREAIPPAGRFPTIPTRLIASNDDSGMRIDHIWVNEHVVVREGWVERAPEADVASDHYPVVVDLVLDDAS